jgi:transposase
MVSIVNPVRIKGFAQSELIRTKTDKIDAGVIARFCLTMKPETWISPSKEIRSLRAAGMPLIGVEFLDTIDLRLQHQKELQLQRSMPLPKPPRK